MTTDDTDDGLYYGWIVTGACFVGSFVVFGVSYSFGVFFEPLVEEFDLSRGATSTVFAVQTLVIYVGAALLGGLADRYGARRLMAVGVVLFAAGLLWTSRATSFAALVAAYGILTALGMGLIYVVTYATIPRWFGRRRGFASGIATSGLGIGMVAVAPVAAFLIGQYGWRDTYLALVAAFVAALALATVFVSDSPRSRGVDPSVEFPDGYPDSRTGRGWREQLRDVWAVATSRTFLLVFAGWVLIYGTIFVVFVHLVAHATDVGMAERTGALAISTIGATTALARLVIGFASDRVGRLGTFVTCSAVMGGSMLMLPVLSSPVGLFAFAIVFGVAYGGNGALLAPMTADLFGTENVNAVFGLVSVSFSVSGLLAPPLAGLGHDLLGTYTPAFVVVGALALVGAGLVAVAGRDARGD